MHWAEGERTGERLIKFGRRSLCLRWAVGARKTPTLGAGELRGTSLARRGRRQRRRGAPAPSRALIGWRAGPYLLRERGRIFSPSSAPLAEAAWSRGMRGRPAPFCSCFLRWLGGGKRGRKLSKEVTIAASSTASRKPSRARQRPPAPVLLAQTQ